MQLRVAQKRDQVTGSKLHLDSCVSRESPGLHTWLMLWSQCAQPDVVNECSSTKLVSACIPSAWVVHAGASCGLFVSHVCSNPFAGSSKLGRVLDHVPLIESKPPGPETEVLSDASQKQVQKSENTSPQQQLQDLWCW